MKKSILKMMLLGGVIFGFNHAQASTIAEEAPIKHENVLVEETSTKQENTMVEAQDPRVICVIQVLIRGSQMVGAYPQDVLDDILQIEMEKCADGTHSSLPQT
ncbi:MULTISPECIES: hypothetical protein [Sphingobacterium]|uniref:hypothetical protein n=1 Tax=Sphingobacterium TaxID=28453 RepID=UPI00257B4357|nr:MULTISPECIES: hypothetical protein [Sphingobacterium]